MWKKLFIGLGVVVVFLIVAALLAPMLIPAETYREQIRSRVFEATGRELTIAGEISFRLLPSIAFSAEDVSFANAPDGRAEHMATLQELQVEVALLPLISGDFVIERLVLIEPDIFLEANADGSANWMFEPPPEAENQQQQEQSAQERPADDTQAEGGAPSILRLGDVRIEDGRIRYSDASSGESYDLRGVTLGVSLPDLQSTLTADGEITYNDQTVSLDARLDSPASLDSEEGAATRIEVAGDLLTMRFDGRLQTAEAMSASGALDLQIPSLRRLMAWLGSPMEAGDENSFQRFALQGQLALSGQRASLSGANVRFDEIAGTGDFAVNLAGSVPAISARLDVESLDLTPYLGEGATRDDGDGGDSAQSDDAAAGGWSREPFDTSALQALNADLAFSAESMRMRDVSIGRSRLTVALQSGVLTATLGEAALYGGNGSGIIVLDGRQSDSLGLSIRNLSLSGLEAEPFLRDVAGYDRLTGTAAFSILAASGRGAHMQALMSSLATSGEGGRFEFQNGSLKGYNLAAAVRHAGTLFTDPSVRDSRDTDFTRLGGTFTIANGILANDDLEMVSPLLRLAGAGTADIGDQRLDYRIEPRAVLSLEGQGGREDLGGLIVPLDCIGPWATLNCRPDLTGIRVVGGDGQLSLPNRESLQTLPENMRERVPENLRRFLPDRREEQQQDGQEGTQSQEEQPDARDRIRGIIRDRRGADDGDQSQTEQDQQQESTGDSQQGETEQDQQQESTGDGQQGEAEQDQQQESETQQEQEQEAPRDRLRNLINRD